MELNSDSPRSENLNEQNKVEILTRTGISGDDILLCADLYLWVSNIRKAKSAQKRLTHSFPRKRITSPMTLTFPIRSIIFIINPVARTEALWKPFPVIAICSRKWNAQSFSVLYKNNLISTCVALAYAFAYNTKHWCSKLKTYRWYSIGIMGLNNCIETRFEL